MLITKEDYLKRIEEAKRRMEKDDIDLLLIYGDAWRDANFRYFVGCTPFSAKYTSYEIPYGPFALLAIPINDSPIYFVVDVFVECVKEELKSLDEELWVEVLPWSEAVSKTRRLKEKLRLNKIGFTNKDIVPYPVFTVFRSALGDMKQTYIPESMRLIKSEKEIKLMEKAANIADMAYGELGNILKTGKTEREVAQEITSFMISEGAEQVESDTLIMSGPYIETKVGKARNVPIKRGELLLLHITPRYEGYCCDCDRGLGFGKITREQEELLEIVKEACERGIKAIRPTIKGSDVLNAAKSVDERIGIVPGLVYGHGIGLQFEEIGFIDDWIFEPGMTFTFAAGAYVKDVGAVRVEDVCVVTKTGGKSLNSFERAPIID
jgi:Xaa-Pro aminopeptidase